MFSLYIYFGNNICSALEWTADGHSCLVVYREHQTCTCNSNKLRSFTLLQQQMVSGMKGQIYYVGFEAWIFSIARCLGMKSEIKDLIFCVSVGIVAGLYHTQSCICGNFAYDGDRRNLVFSRHDKWLPVSTNQHGCFNTCDILHLWNRIFRELYQQFTSVD